MISARQNKGSWKSMSITNQHASTAATVSLYLHDGGGDADSQVYIAGPVDIPSGVTLYLENVSFDNDIYNLYITTAGSGHPLSIIAR